MARQEAHRIHIVLAPMPALVTGTGRLAINRPWKRITVLAVRAPWDGPRIQPCGPAQQHSRPFNRK